jgi:thymidine kinase
LAHNSFRTTESDTLVLVGEKENYEPLSRTAFNKAQKKKKDNNGNI